MLKVANNPFELSFIILNVVMLSVAMLNVVAPKIICKTFGFVNETLICINLYFQFQIFQNSLLVC